MARPKRSENEKLTELIQIRVSKNEKQNFKQQAYDANLPESEYGRRRLNLGITRTEKHANPERASVIKAILYIGKLCHEMLQKGYDQQLIITLQTVSKNVIKFLDGNSRKS